MEQTNQGVYLVYALNLNKSEHTSIQPGKPLYFSNREKAEDVIRHYQEIYHYLYDAHAESSVYCLVLEKYAMDTTFRYQLSTWVYSAEGIFLSDCVVPDDGPFFGRQKSGICHEIGDIVEIPYGERLVFGIVVEQPLCLNEENQIDYGFTASDDCYTVIKYPENEIHYAHSPMVFKPTTSISEHVRDELQTAFQYIMQEKLKE
ncbi:MAG TPA: hypothetical protein VFP20_01655 [Bacteroidales bacterium]|nr:hypothetical protein [Bacteroidales bacterium]